MFDYLDTMVPVLPLVQGVRVRRDPTEKKRDGRAHRRDGLQGWEIPVIYPISDWETGRAKITYWGSKPAVSAGDMVFFPDIHVGGFDGGAYFWATTVETIEEDDRG